MALHIALLFFLGLAGLFHETGIATASLVLLAFATPVVFTSTELQNWWKTLKRFRSKQLIKLQAAEKIMHGLVIIGLFIIIASFALHAPGIWDDTSYHLPYAQHYLDHHDLRINEYLRFPLFPNNLNLLFAFGLASGGIMMAQAMATLPLFIIAIGLIGACRQFFNTTIALLAGVLATALFISLGPIQAPLGYAYVDNGLALFCWASLLALMQITSEKSVSKTVSFSYPWLIIAGMLAGTAAGVKLFGVVWVGLLGLYVLLQTRQLKTALIFSLSVIAFGSWWYIRSFLISGDPIHPAGGSIFGHFLWNENDLFRQTQEQGRHGVDKNLLHVWDALVKAKITWLAPAFFAPLFFRHASRLIIYAYGVFLAYFLFWFFATQVSRYLTPLLPVGSFLVVYVLYRCGIGKLVELLKIWWPRVPLTVIATLVSVILVGLAVPHELKKANQYIAQWGQVLESRRGYGLYQQANALIPLYGPELVQVGFENGIFFYQGQAIGDWFGPGRYSQFLDCQNKSCQLIAPDEMAALMAQYHSHMFIVNIHRFNIDLDAYRNDFDVYYGDDDGYLLVLKRPFVDNIP
jgi:hypothetical protein